MSLNTTDRLESDILNPPNTLSFEFGWLHPSNLLEQYLLYLLKQCFCSKILAQCLETFHFLLILPKYNLAIVFKEM